MTALLLAPHNDDETLFASFLLQRYEPLVVVCLRSQVQEDRYGITAAQREYETESALRELGQVEHFLQLGHLDREVSWEDVRVSLAALANVRQTYSPVIAPAWEDGGHDHHNGIASLAADIWGGAVLSYTTYTRHGGRTRSSEEVEPQPPWIAAKHRALACYRTQIAEPSCRPWFLGDVREYVA